MFVTIEDLQSRDSIVCCMGNLDADFDCSEMNKYSVYIIWRLFYAVLP